MKLRSGLTLLELIVVVAILAIIALIVLPKLDGLRGNVNHAVGGVSADDTGRYVLSYHSMKNRYPDGWDSLTDGSSLWTAANLAAKTKGLHTQLSGATNPKLQYTTLTASEAAALNNVGIGTLFNVTPTTGSTRPGDMFNTPVTLTTGASVAQVTNTNMINHIYRNNLLTTGSSGATTSTSRLIAFGFGPHNELVGKMMIEAPSYPNVDSSLIYNRNLVVFEVGTTARFKGVFGADGDLLDDLTSNMSKDFQ